MSLKTHWDRQYREGEPIWDSDRPTSELLRVVREEHIPPVPTLDLGCGSGSNAVWLARQGFTVTGIDMSPAAIQRARQRAWQAGVAVRFRCGDLRNLSGLDGPFAFFVDCGCYGAMQLRDAPGYLAALERVTRRGTSGLVLTGNDHEPEDKVGPPVLSAARLRADFGRLFGVVQLRAFRFDAHQGNGKRYLGWSLLLRRQ